MQGDEDELNNIIESWNIRDTQNSTKSIYDTPTLKPTPDQISDVEDGFSTPKQKNRTSLITPSRKSAYVRRSVDRRNKETSHHDPFVENKDSEDFRFDLRADTQVLYSLLDIDSKHIDLGQKHAEGLVNETQLNSELEIPQATKFEISEISECLRFITHKYK